MMKKILIFILMMTSLSLFANEAHNALMKRSHNEQTAILEGAVNSAEDTPHCTAISSFFQGMDNYDSAHWNVACSNGQSYQVSIENDSGGSTKILECDFLKSIGVECFKKY